MFELLVLMAIAYAGARGVEAAASTADRRHASKDAETAVAKVAAGKSAEKPPGPTEPGGTFSAASPRAARLGGKAAVPLAVLTETSATMWKATLEGYRQRWPEIRRERRRAMAARADRKKAADAVAKAGPPPPYPPPPADPPQTAGTKPGEEERAEDAKAEEADPPGRDRAEATEARVAEAEKKAEEARLKAEEEVRRAASEKVLAAQKAEREAKEREAAAEKRAREAEERARAAETAAAAKTPDRPDQPDHQTSGGRPRLRVVPAAQEGDSMSSPTSIIPEIRTLDGLMNALTITKAMCEMRSEEALAIAADDLELASRLDQLEAELGELDVDDGTIGEIAELRESIHAQSQAAAQYGGIAKDAGDFAVAAAQAAHKSHGGIAEAVQSSPIEKAAQGGYYEH